MKGSIFFIGIDTVITTLVTNKETQSFIIIQENLLKIIMKLLPLEGDQILLYLFFADSSLSSLFSECPNIMAPAFQG